MSMTGYQQGVLVALGTTAEGKYVVRSLDRWYCDVVSELCDSTVYKSDYNKERDGRPQWVIKSSKITRPSLCDVTDWVGFCRAYIEIHGVVDLKTSCRPDKSHYYTPRLRVYGKRDVLTAITTELPYPNKKVYDIRTTSAIYYQSISEVISLVFHLQGEPCHAPTHEKWHDVLMKYKPE